MTELYRNYHPHDVDLFYEDLEKQIVKFTDKTKSKRNVSPVSRKNYTKDEQVGAWNITLRNAHQEFIKSGKTEEAKFPLIEVA